MVPRESESLTHHIIRDLPALLTPGDLLVLNDTKVLPARLLGSRAATGGQWEGLFLREVDGGQWELMTKTRGHPGSGEIFRTDSGLDLQLCGRTPDHRWLMKALADGSAVDLLHRHGHVPLPPYIRKGRDRAEDRDRYQTVYAAAPGSVAAPTAGLHFTPELLAALIAAGVRIANVTLHVGLGTFAPIQTADPTQHAIHEEWCEVNTSTVNAIRETKAAGRRVIAVGTTTTRALETSVGQTYLGPSKLFIHPPYQFQVINGLLTNFHLPRTTLLLMVQSLTGPDLLRRAYQEAIRHEYHFYSYGDAMLVL